MAGKDIDLVRLMGEPKTCLVRERDGGKTGYEVLSPAVGLFDMPPTEHLEAEMVEMMKKTGAHPAAIYAFEKTGLLVTEGNRDKFTDADLAEWDAAVEEYLQSHPGSDGD